MKTFVAALLVLAAAGPAIAQVKKAGGLEEVHGVRHARWVDGQIVPGKAPDSGNSIWDNTGISAWWSGCGTGYVNLDWGRLPLTLNGLDDFVIDGFSFAYGTNNNETYAESYAVYFFDSCTGWGNLGVEEAGFLFSGLPGYYWHSTTPPGYAIVWIITVDIEGTGYEFLLGQEFGFGLSRENTPTMGSSGIAIGIHHPMNGTDNAFDIYYPNGIYNGTWWFGTSYWATWATELFGTEGESNMTFYGVGARGNDAGLYATGDFAAGNTVQFLVRDNEFGLDSYLAASRSAVNRYIGGSYDVTCLVGKNIIGFPMKMDRSPVGDFHRLSGLVTPQAASATIYFQALLSDSNLMQPPVDASNGMRAN